MPPNLADRCIPIELLVVDVDGVLTDGGIVYSDQGVEWKKFHSRDGVAFKLWQLAGKRAAMLSGRASKIVAARAAELSLSPVIQGATDKMPGYRQILAATGMRPEQVCYIGDDLPDLPVLLHCGLSATVADACADVRAAVHYVTHKRGGAGAVRELVEVILRGQGLWSRLVERFRGERP